MWKKNWHLHANLSKQDPAIYFLYHVAFKLCKSQCIELLSPTIPLVFDMLAINRLYI